MAVVDRECRFEQDAIEFGQCARMQRLATTFEFLFGPVSQCDAP